MGFTFEETQKIEVNGKQYECDPQNNDLLTGMYNGWGAVASAITKEDELANLFRNSLLVPAQADETKVCAMEVLKANEETFSACRAFIEGTLGKDEYAEIFAGRKPNTKAHIDLCVYILQFILGGRDDYLDEFRAAVEEDLKPDAAATTAGQNSEPASADKLSLVDEKRRARAGFKAFLRRKG